jgi:hypothetical protein
MSHDEGSNFLDLEAESEWRFELDADESIAVRVSDLSLVRWLGRLECEEERSISTRFELSVSEPICC